MIIKLVKTQVVLYQDVGLAQRAACFSSSLVMQVTAAPGPGRTTGVCLYVSAAALTNQPIYSTWKYPCRIPHH
jgi:hypothetical protein